MDQTGRHLTESAQAVLEQHWQEQHGFTVPNPVTYPNRWLWDSCFHSIIWAALGDSRCELELVTLFQSERDTGFVPHIWYPAPDVAAERFWGVTGCSTLSQPPMFGHAIAVMAEAGRPVPSLVGPATQAMWWLLRSRRAPSGLVYIVHPWESGFDDHPRWDPWLQNPVDPGYRWRVKGELVAALDVGLDGAAVGSRKFEVCSAGFNALVAWNAAELGRVTKDARLVSEAGRIARTLDEFWDASRRTWVDSTMTGAPGSAVQTVDSLLGALVTSDRLKAQAALAAVTDPAVFGTAFGPSSVAVLEPTFDPKGYGRGGVWPQLIYLLWRAAQQLGDTDLSAQLVDSLATGATESGFAEYWDANTGQGEGAVPQSWTGLAAVPYW